MGIGPDPGKENLSFKERCFPAHGTLAQLWKLQNDAKKKDGGAVETDGDEEGMLLNLPRDKYPDLDKFEDILEAGTRVASRSRRLLIAIPFVFLELNTMIFVGLAYYADSVATENNLSAFELIDQKSWLFQFGICVFSWVCTSILMALQPTFTRAIAYTAIALAVQFIVCGLILCPNYMPPMMPDSTGTVRLIWQVCGYTKCVLIILSLIYSVCQHPPRLCLRVIEWCLCVAVAGIGVFLMLSCYYVVKDNVEEGAIDASFFLGYLLMIVVTIVMGAASVTGMPRVIGKKILKALAWHTEPGASYEYQVLASTIATMIGVDANYRAVITKALWGFRGVSMADITWEEFAESTPNPKCFAKSKRCAFKEIDFFVSHSWSDDPEAKWEAIQGMRKTFKAENKGREPVIWFDKYCIDQTAIDESVRRLPVFVVGSSKFLVLLGPSYASRCWCMLELFVFNSVRNCALFDETADFIVLPLAGAKKELKQVRILF